MAHIPSYPSIFNLGHKALETFFDNPIIVEEKVDGSQFSFGIVDGELSARSKGSDLVIESPEKMFTKGIETVKELEGVLTPGWIYRGEYLQKPKHNTLMYGRVPERNIIIYDIMIGPEAYLGPDEKAAEAARIGLECVPMFALPDVMNVEVLKELCARESVLGGVHMEGVVMKNYFQFGPDKKVLLAKYVREEFKEAHRTAWKAANPNQGDVVDQMIAIYKVEARWRKAVQHLREKGELTDSPKDIGPLMKEIPADILKEHADEIKQELFDLAWPKIVRGVTSGFPQFYKDLLAETMFDPQSTGNELAETEQGEVS